MKKLKFYIIPIVIMTFCIGIMRSGSFLKKSFSKEDNVLLYIESLKKDVEKENWNQAKQDIVKVKSAWKIVGRRVQFSVERTHMDAIDMKIARIIGGIWAEDKNSVLIELSEFIGHWDDLER